jgi:hypothetical protein
VSRAIAIVFVLAGCAKIESFEALPRYACVGEAVVLTWKIKGDAVLAVDPPTPTVNQDGRHVIHPRANTRVTLVAERFFDSSKPAVQEITVSQAESQLVTAPVDDQGTCAGGVLRMPVTISQFSDAIKVARVSTAADDPHSYTVEHEGRSGMVAPNATSDAFAGTPINGAWTLSAALLPSEQCGTPTLPRNLVVQVTTQCGGQP